MSFRAIAVLFRTDTVIAAAANRDEIELRALRAMAQLGVERCRIECGDDAGRTWHSLGEYTSSHD